MIDPQSQTADPSTLPATAAATLPRARRPIVRRLDGQRASYTLIELLITVSIIAIMASMVLFALYAAQEQARVQKTRALVTKLGNVVRSHYESYRTRRVPVTFDPNDPPQLRAKIRLDVLRDMMRMEMPDRWSDVTDDPVAPFGEDPMELVKRRPSSSRAYSNKYVLASPKPSLQNQNAECLYMIVMAVLAREGDARDVFRADDVADTDDDGFPEFVDAWGTPIRFLRWAPGFISDLQVLARGVLNLEDAGPPTIFTLPVAGTGLSTDASRYLGGTVAVLIQGRIDGERMARITGYEYDENGTPGDISDDFVRITCAEIQNRPPFPSGSVEPFQPGGAVDGAEVAILAPDPFDPRGVYPIAGSAITTHSFALYPLVYSAGPDKAFGIVSDVDPDPDASGNPQNPEYPLVYGDVDLNPCFVPTNVGSLPYSEMMGAYPQTSGEENFYVGCWDDNIHNHQLNLR